MAISISGKLSAYFTRANQADMVSKMAPPINPLTQFLFPEGKRRQKTSPLIRVGEVFDETGAIPVSIRGTRSFSVDGTTSQNSLIEVFPLNPAIVISAKEINDLIVLGDTESINQMISDRTTQLRNIIVNSTEVMVRQAMSGKISYPLFTGTSISGTYDVELGQINKLSSENIKAYDFGKLQMFFENLYNKQAATGAGTDVYFMAGTEAYSKIVSILQAMGNLAPVIWSPEGMTIMGKYKILSMGLTYTLPGKKELQHVLHSNAIRTFDRANAGILFYAALDDLDAKLAPLPFFIKPLDVVDPSGVKLIAESKPLPALAYSKMNEIIVQTA